MGLVLAVDLASRDVDFGFDSLGVGGVAAGHLRRLLILGLQGLGFGLCFGRLLGFRHVLGLFLSLLLRLCLGVVLRLLFVLWLLLLLFLDVSSRSVSLVRGLGQDQGNQGLGRGELQGK